jgi:hypothetical protein
MDLPLRPDPVLLLLLCCCCCHLLLLAACWCLLQGDIMDIVMMCVSTAVFVYLSMQMYRLYAYAYYHAEAYRQLTDMMN